MKAIKNYFKNPSSEKIQLWVILSIILFNTLLYLTFEVWIK